ncbi:MAG TPA: PAS domain-containing protein, partial [Geminicoccaceae bacterium]|nr:PAS domain-containing protein [Geminicoccaceae bacterium]
IGRMRRASIAAGMDESPAFLAGGGEMGALIRAHDWAATPLGPPEGWPQGLRTAVRLALTTRHPIFIFWGEQHVCLYNDGYRPSLGPEKHPSILGAPGCEAWPEIWPIIGPQIELVMRGEGATWHENQLVPIVRHGGLQEVYWPYSYGPIDDETGPNGVGGVLVLCTETTSQILAERRAAAELERLAAMFQQAPGFICTLRGRDHVFEFVNDEHLRLFNSGDWAGKPVREAFPDIAGQGFYELLDQVYATGERVVVQSATARFRPTPDAPEQEMLLDFIYAPMVDDAGTVTGIYCSGYDVTDRRRAEAALRESEVDLREAQRLAHVGSWTWSAATDVTIGSPELYRIYGLDPDKDPFPDFREQRGVLYPVESWETINAAVQRSVASGVGYELDVEALRGSEPIWITTRCEVVRDGGNRVVALRGTVQDISEHKRAERAEAEQRRLLELVAAGRPLDECLTEVTAAVTRLEPRARAGILLADAERKTFPTSYAANIPPSSRAGLKDAPINDLAIGTCGEAVFTGRSVTCPDIASDERWSQPWRELCVAHGILACHSEPVIGADDRCLGSLMLCFGEAREPSEWELRVAAFAVRVAGIAIERDRADQELQASEARYRTLFTAVDEGFCIVELEFDASERPIDYRFIEINPAFEGQTGLVDAVGKTARELVPGLERHWFDIYGRVALTGEPARFENGSDAMGRWFDVYALRVGEPDARRVAILFTDISERRRAEAKLRDLNETLERRVAAALAERKVLADIVEGTDAFVQVADLDFRWLAINKASADEFERIFGVRPKAGDSMLDLLAGRPEHQAAVREVWSRALAGEEFTEIGEFGDPSLDRRHYEMKFNTLRDRDGNRIGAYQFVHDVTQRLRDQARLAQAEEQLRQAQKIEAIGQLTGGVAHDFNNLLTVVAGGLRLLERQPDPERRRRVLDGMRQTVERGAGLTRQLLAFGRRQALNPEPVDLAYKVRGMHDMLARSLRGDIRVELAAAPGAWPVEVDPGELELALLNLCVNARDAMPEGGVITVAIDDAAPGGDLVRLSVTDTGAGMPPEVLARALEPFFTTKEVGKGSGLGLAQVYGFAEQSGGDVEIASEVGRGTTVTVTLPRSAREPEPAEQRREAADRLSPDGADGPAGHVLLVEDDEEVAALTRGMLDSLGFEVTRVASAAAALGALADGRAIDIVFSDVMMPGGTTGVELARQLRRRRPDLPVVLTTGFAGAAGGARAEGFDLLLKPYRLEALSATLRAHLRDAR